ncbi:MAG: hypothetical protein AAGF32_06855, partial [Pseudomonadota bacterium]
MRDGIRQWLVYDPLRHRYFQIDAAAVDLLRHWRSAPASAFQLSVSAALCRKVDAREIERVVAFLTAKRP